MTPYERDRTDEGYEAAKGGMTVGANPYDPEAEREQYESWLNGWALGSRELQEQRDAGC